MHIYLQEWEEGIYSSVLYSVDYTSASYNTFKEFLSLHYCFTLEIDYVTRHRWIKWKKIIFVQRLIEIETANIARFRMLINSRANSFEVDYFLRILLWFIAVVKNRHQNIRTRVHTFRWRALFIVVAVHFCLSLQTYWFFNFNKLIGIFFLSYNH